MAINESGNENKNSSSSSLIFFLCEKKAAMKKKNNRFEWENKEGGKRKTQSFLIISQKAEALGDV